MGLVLGTGATIAAMALPLAYPDAPKILWQLLLWAGLAVALLSGVVLLYDLVFANRILSKRSQPRTDQLYDVERDRFEKIVLEAIPKLRDLIQERNKTKPFFPDGEYTEADVHRHQKKYQQWNKGTLALLRRDFLSGDLAEIGRVGLVLGLIHRDEIEIFVAPRGSGDLEQAYTRLQSLPKFLHRKNPAL